MAEQPNDASRKDKAEGERWTDQSSEDESGISNRSMDDADGRVRSPLDTPRRYDQPIEDDHDPVMPSDDTTLNTKI